MDINGKDSDKKMKGRNQLVPFNDVLKSSGSEILNVLPAGLDEADKKDMAKAMIYLTIKAYNEMPELRKCSPDSIISSLMECASLGMMPFSKMNECAIIPYGGKAQMQLEYRGIQKLCRNTGEYKNIRTGVVREGDTLEYYKGLSQDLRHFESKAPAHNRKITHVYALYELLNGGSDFEVMTIEDLEAHRDKYSKQYKNAKKYNKEKSAIWVKEFESMARKTVLIKVLKYAPKSDKLVNQLALDRDLKREIAPERKDFTEEKEAEFVRQKIADATGTYDTTVAEPKKKTKKKPEPADEDVIVNQNDIARFYATMTDLGLTKEEQELYSETVKKKYKVKSKKELTVKEINKAIEALEKRAEKKKEAEQTMADFDKAEKEGKI